MHNKKRNKQEVSIVRSSAAEYLTFVAASGSGGVEAVYADETIWLTQKMMGLLYDVDVRTINCHLKKIFNVNSERAVQFRKWATTVIDEYSHRLLNFPIIGLYFVMQRVTSQV